MVRVEFYILGLLKFDREEVVFSDEQLNQVCDCFKVKFGNPKKFGPWRVWFLDNKSVKRMFLKDIKSDVKFKIFECKLGYYHHRIILHLAMDVEKIGSLQLVRKIREPLHSNVRILFNKLLPKKIEKDKKPPKGEYPAVKILYVYTYPLIIIHDGRKILEELIKDTTFSTPTTTFFLEIPERSSIVTLRTHFMRISIPSVIVFCDKKLGSSVFWDLTNGIYYSCLYEKKMQDARVNFKNKRNDRTLFKLNERLLRRLSSYLLSHVAAVERQKVATRLTNTALVISTVAIVMMLVTFLLRLFGIL